MPVAVVANPDSPVGRKKVVTPPPVKIIALAHNIPILQPEKLNEEFLTELRNLAADIYIVAAYGKILPKSLINIPAFGVINIHPSLLPKY